MLWEGDDLPLASALQIAHGSLLYRDVWFDKPPLVPTIYLVWGARIGPVLRIAGAMYAMAACVIAWAFAAGVWTRREGYWAAALLGFFLTFDTHSAVLPLAADLLLVVPHLAAVMFAIRKQAFWSGVAVGVGFLFNTKALFVLAACAVFAWPAAGALLAGFFIPNLMAAAWFLGTGTLAEYIDQVWRWPAAYAASPVVPDPIWNGFVRTFNWLGFHSILAVGIAVFWLRRPGWRFLAWAAIAFAGVVVGWRFFPRYFFLLLPALTIGAARGLTFLRMRVAIPLALVALSVPLIRFGPRYLMLANDLIHGRPSAWTDLALDRDSREASRIATSRSKAGATLYVWGYRPEIYVYTRLRPATKFLDCQALTGVPADRHLTQSEPVITVGTHEAREELARSSPDVLIDGLSPFNPALSMSAYQELRPWLAQFEEIARTSGTVIYLRRGAATTIGW